MIAKKLTLIINMLNSFSLQGSLQRLQLSLSTCLQATLILVSKCKEKHTINQNVTGAMFAVLFYLLQINFSYIAIYKTMGASGESQHLADRLKTTFYF